MSMNFLNKIDLLYNDVRIKYDVPDENTSFGCFIPVIAKDFSPSCEFIIKKQEKSKLLICVGKQRIYLSDQSIIKTILEMNNNDIDWFLKQFVLLYRGVSADVRFEIDSMEFKGYGIEYYYPSKKITLFSDSEIDINDFIFLLNFIFSKDKCWEEENKLENFSKRTLCKYISLVDYYSKQSERSTNFLKSINYPIERRHPVDNKDTKKLFNSIELFDISLF